MIPVSRYAPARRFLAPGRMRFCGRVASGDDVRHRVGPLWKPGTSPTGRLQQLDPVSKLADELVDALGDTPS